MSAGAPPADVAPRSPVRRRFGRSLEDALGPHRRTIVNGLLWRAAEGAASTVPLVVVAWFAARVVDGTLDGAFVALASAIVALAVGAALVSGWAGNRLLFPGAYDVGRDLRRRLVIAVRSAPVGAVLARPRGEVVTTVDRDVADVESAVNGSLPGLVANGAAAIVAVAAIVGVDAVVGTALVAGTALLAVAQFAKLRAQAASTARRQQLRAGQDERIVEFVQGIEVAKAFGMRGALAAQLDRALRSYRDANLASVRRTIPIGAAVSAAGSFAAGLVLAVAGARYGSGALDGPRFAAVVVLAAGAARSLLALGSGTGALPGLAAALHRIERLDALPRRTVRSPGPPPAGSDVALRDVHFSYGGEPVLRGVTCDACEGSMTVVVGRSGAGKTTLLHLLAGLWEPDRGAIRIGDVDLAELSDDQRTELLSIVPQDPWLPDGSVRDAIASGIAGGADDERIVAAARSAQCHDTIVELPHGYDTVVGEGGRLLSGGQRQRVAIARALLADTPIVCLDEATAALDATSERALHAAFDALRDGRTIVMVAHRPSTIRRADHIVMIDAGRVVEAGSHEDLLARGGPYAARWAAREDSEQQGFSR